ncbi:MAG: GGDEF domain-containing protein [Proteobacteria bacterium]|nr:GGDEF domain-containing protein [Pseudomonadota bacterium]HQR05029.1 GGDEF domain-containing protein [Rhodocyclaceae bacterium]
MSALDPVTLVTVTGLLNLMCAVVMFELRRALARSVPSLRPWCAGTVLALASMPLYTLRGLVAPELALILANGLMLAALMLYLAGLYRLRDKPIPLASFVAAWAASVACTYVVAVIWMNDTLRLIVSPLAYAILLCACAIESWRLTDLPHGRRFATTVFGFGAIISLLRSLTALAGIGLLNQTAEIASPVHKMYVLFLGLSVVLITTSFIVMTLESLLRKVEAIAAHDALSGAMSRAALMASLERERARSLRNGQPLSILLMDLDHFKSINDRFGHLTGDQVIVDFVARARQSLRQQDSIGRYGGEEFLALLPETGPNEARLAAERLRAGITCEGDLPPYSVSIGVATLTPDESITDLIRAADQALYRAKAAGRDRVELALPAPVLPLSVTARPG